MKEGTAPLVLVDILFALTRYSMLMRTYNLYLKIIGPFGSLLPWRGDAGVPQPQPTTSIFNTIYVVFFRLEFLYVYLQCEGVCCFQKGCEKFTKLYADELSNDSKIIPQIKVPLLYTIDASSRSLFIMCVR